MSYWQIANTFIPLAGMFYVMYLSLDWSYFLTLLLAIPTTGLVVRVFIIQHDCGHHSFFRSRRANDVLGVLCGVITVTPYYLWRRTHARHHATSGNLDHRGQGDIHTLTIDEFTAKSFWGRVAYRLYRHPLVMFFIGAPFMFLIRHRLTYGIPKSWRRERNSVHHTNLGIALVIILLLLTIGWQAMLLVWMPVAFLAAAVGSWMFFVQHQFEDAYWQPKKTWDFTDAALEGSSYYRLPHLLHWFTGNIGYHHIHHLNSRIPNYHLACCHNAEPTLRESPSFGMWESLGCAKLKLWDAQQQRLVTFAQADERQSDRNGNATATTPETNSPVSGDSPS